MSTLKLKKKPGALAPAGERRPPLRAGGVKRPRPTLAQAEAERAQRRESSAPPPYGRPVGEPDRARRDQPASRTRRDDPRAAPRRDDPRAPPRREDPRAAPRRDDPRAAPRRDDPRAAPRRDDPRAAPRRDDPRAAPRRDDPRAAPRRDDPRAAPRRDDPRAAPRRDDPRAAPRREDPRTTAGRDATRPPQRRDEAPPAARRADTRPPPRRDDPRHAPRRDPTAPPRSRDERAPAGPRRGEPPGPPPAARDTWPRREPPPRREAPPRPADRARVACDAPAPRPPADAVAPLHAAGTLRLSKRIAELGLASRREADEWIEQGFVRVDGAVVDQLGARVLPGQRIEIDPQARAAQAQRVTVLLHKPVGYVSGQAEDGHEPAITLVTPKNRWAGDASGLRFHGGQLRNLAPAGRLDIDSTGLLVLTQDGRIAKALIGEDSKVEKEYLVRVAWPQHPELADLKAAFPADQLARLRHGLALDGEKLKPAKVSWQNEQQLRFVLREGKKRQIRRMCELVGLQVIGLKRIRMGRIGLGELPPGQWRFMAAYESFL